MKTTEEINNIDKKIECKTITTVCLFPIKETLVINLKNNSKSITEINDCWSNFFGQKLVIKKFYG